MSGLLKNVVTKRIRGERPPLDITDRLYGHQPTPAEVIRTVEFAIVDAAKRANS